MVKPIWFPSPQSQLPSTPYTSSGQCPQDHCPCSLTLHSPTASFHPNSPSKIHCKNNDQLNSSESIVLKFDFSISPPRPIYGWELLCAISGQEVSPLIPTNTRFPSTSHQGFNHKDLND